MSEKILSNEKDIEYLLTKLTSKVLEGLTVSDLNYIIKKEWLLGVNLDEDELRMVFLWRKRNENNFTCRFAPKNIEVCYLATDPLSIEREIKFIGTAKKVSVKEGIKLLNFDLNGAQNAEHVVLMRENNIFEKIEDLMKGPRTPDNYKDSVILADYVLKKGFDGIYYSPHPDAKYPEGEIAIKSCDAILDVSPHFDLNNTMGPKNDPMLVIFKTKVAEKNVHFI